MTGAGFPPARARIVSARRRETGSPAPHPDAGPRLVRYRLFGDTGPDLVGAVTVARALRAAALRAGRSRLGDNFVPAELLGPRPGEATDGRHLHPYWLPVDHDGDMRVDHVDVFAWGGFTSLGLRVLADIDELVVDGAGAWGVAPVRITDDPGSSARQWISATPYVGPLRSARSGDRPRRSGFGVEAQLRESLSRFRRVDGSRLPTFEISPLGRDCPSTGVSADAFRKGRKFKSFDGEDAGYFELRFAEPVVGPLAFGLESHFGLGRFRPIE